MRAANAVWAGCAGAVALVVVAAQLRDEPPPGALRVGAASSPASAARLPGIAEQLNWPGRAAAPSADHDLVTLPQPSASASMPAPPATLPPAPTRPAAKTQNELEEAVSQPDGSC